MLFIVQFYRYLCNKCEAVIVGTRFHCQECDNFDLCLGCQESGQFPPGHVGTHSSVTMPMVKGEQLNCTTIPPNWQWRCHPESSASQTNIRCTCTCMLIVKQTFSMFFPFGMKVKLDIRNSLCFSSVIFSGRFQKKL